MQAGDNRDELVIFRVSCNVQVLGRLFEGCLSGDGNQQWPCEHTVSLDV